MFNKLANLFQSKAFIIALSIGIILVVGTVLFGCSSNNQLQEVSIASTFVSNALDDASANE